MCVDGVRRSPTDSKTRKPRVKGKRHGFKIIPGSATDTKVTAYTGASGLQQALNRSAVTRAICGRHYCFYSLAVTGWASRHATPAWQACSAGSWPFSLVCRSIANPHTLALLAQLELLTVSAASEL